MTNNEARVAHRILQKHGIEHKLLGHRLPLTSNEFAIEIGIIRCTEFDCVRKYIKFIAGRYRDAVIDLESPVLAAEIAEAVRRDADADKP